MRRPTARGATPGKASRPLTPFDVHRHCLTNNQTVKIILYFFFLPRKKNNGRLQLDSQSTVTLYWLIEITSQLSHFPPKYQNYIKFYFQSILFFCNKRYGKSLKRKVKSITRYYSFYLFICYGTVNFCLRMVLMLV